MSIVKESLLFRLLLAAWRRLCRDRDASRLCRAFFSLGPWLSERWEHSFLGHFFYGESRFTRAWDGSALRRGLEWALNLPVRGLQWLYRRLRRLFDESFFAWLAFELGGESMLVAGCFIALILSIPYESWNNRCSLAASALVLMLVYADTMREEGRRLTLGSVGPYAVLFFAAVAASVPMSNYPGLSLRFLSYYISCVLIVLALANGVKSSRELLRLAGGLALGILVASCYGLYQRLVLKIGVVIAYIDPGLNSNLPGRVYSFFENPNAFGHLLLLALPVLAALVFSSKRWLSRLCAAGVFCAALACMIMTYCRAAWVGLAVAAAVYVFLWNWKLLPLLLAAGLAALPLLPDSVLTRLVTIFNLKDTTTSSRFPQYAAALRLLAREPLTGAGLGTDAVRRTVQIDSLFSGRTPFVHSHNTFLQVWMECGALGLLAFVGAMASAVKSAVRSVRRCGDRAARHMAIAGASAISGALVCGLADYLWTYPRIMFVFWFVFGLTLAAVRVCNSDGGASGEDLEI